MLPSSRAVVRGFKQRRRRRQRERQKTAAHFLTSIFCRCWATIAWKCSIFRLVEDLNSPNQFKVPLFSLLSPSSARDKKNGNGLIDRQRKEVMVGEEENRRSVNIFGSNWNLPLPRKANYHWLNGDYPVIIMSTTHLFSHSALALALADVFEKNEKRNKTTSVYRLELTRLTATGIFDVSVFTEAFKFSWHVYALFILSAGVLSAFVYIWKICMLYRRFCHWQPALNN